MNILLRIAVLVVLGLVLRVSSQGDQARCNKPLDLGNGDGKTLKTRYYWDGNRCRTFLYTGKGGNKNRFKTENQCLCACDNNDCDTGSGSNAADCKLKFDPGTCGQDRTRYAYHKKTQQCRRVIGCEYSKNGNNFDSEAACEAACETCNTCNNCPTGQRDDGVTVDNCPRCGCVDCDNCDNVQCAYGLTATRTSTDQNGCWQCSCQRCDTCQISCPRGQRAIVDNTDSQGCVTCSCTACNTCNEANYNCNYGERVTNIGWTSDGCARCECRSCTECTASCSNGQRSTRVGVDTSTGCSVCECRSCDTCWDMGCPNGGQTIKTGTDSNGCARCECQQQTSVCYPETCYCTGMTRPVYYTDWYGCVKCLGCQRLYGCPTMNCPRVCPYGINITLDNDGCKDCGVADDPCKDFDCGEKTCMAQTEKNCYKSTDCTTKPVCVNAEKVCKQPLAKGGPCPKTGSLTRWYHNKVAKECRSFSYKGCLGTKNNFMTKRDCERVCIDE